MTWYICLNTFTNFLQREKISSCHIYRCICSAHDGIILRISYIFITILYYFIIGSFSLFRSSKFDNHIFIDVVLSHLICALIVCILDRVIYGSLITLFDLSLYIYYSLICESEVGLLSSLQCCCDWICSTHFSLSLYSRYPSGIITERCYSREVYEYIVTHLS